MLDIIAQNPPTSATSFFSALFISLPTIPSLFATGIQALIITTEPAKDIIAEATPIAMAIILPSFLSKKGIGNFKLLSLSRQDYFPQEIFYLIYVYYPLVPFLYCTFRIIY